MSYERPFHIETDSAGNARLIFDEPSFLDETEEFTMRYEVDPRADTIMQEAEQ